MATVADVYELVRSFLGDPTPDVWTDAVLLPIVKSGYRDVARKMRAAGVPLFIKESGALVLVAGVTAITRSSTVPLPADLLRPLRLRERITGSSAAYAAMSQQEKDEALPLGQTATTSRQKVYIWRDDQLTFLDISGGSTDIVAIYEADLPALTSSASTVVIPDGVDATSYMAAAICGRRLGTPAFTALHEAKGADVIDAIIRSELKRLAAADGRMGA